MQELPRKPSNIVSCFDKSKKYPVNKVRNNVTCLICWNKCHTFLFQRGKKMAS